MEYDETVYACAVNRIFNYNCREARILTAHFPSPGELFRLSAAELSGFIRRRELIEAILDSRYLQEAEEEVRWARAHGIQILYINDKEYPSRLRECPDAPTVLFHKGTAGLNPRRAVAIVGTRKATDYGCAQCRKIVEHFARLDIKPLIISGLAYGIDICAHLASLECGLDTVAVLPTGLDSIYPAAHRRHAVRIAGQGALVTDFPKGSAPQAVTFLRRNRIIAGMSDAVLLIESAEKGGGLITASLAQSYSREVFAMPGRITDGYSSGCNALIGRNAAEIITSPSSPADSLGWKILDNKGDISLFEKIFENSGYIKRNILLALSADLTVDRNTLIEKAGGDPADVLPGLTELEMDGIVEADIYGNYRLKTFR
ncbi:MAG TPA: DNA-processing protein DprA [Candidatus Coprenecus stercoravium]|uniref:DNA-processing protein DprA n=1 Tax=Candidatus Coprenecus stercoravium TaxID=2840735 RepID=A0A9D2KAB5_9BACT|nr:DNA-processing protein DprA [Candidatus Coprenecus stercoravium]